MQFLFDFVYFSLEPPDVTGSSLTLGTAGSRRTVYLIDDKLPDQSNNAAEKKASTTRTASPSNIASVTSNADNNITQTSTKASTSDAPSTFLMFNRISNVIGANVSGNSTGSTSPSNNGATINANDKNPKEKKKTTEDGKETAIWYEYGCV